MGSYKKEDLYNRYVTEQANEAYRSSCIDQGTYATILVTYPDKLYTPNIFIRIALALLTSVAISFSSVLLFSGMGMSIPLMLFINALICSVALRLFVKKRKYFNAGIDNILICYVIAYLVAAVASINDFSTNSELIFATAMVVSLVLSIAFIDAFAALVSCVSFIILSFLVFIKLGTFAHSAVPFFIGALCIAIYLIVSKYSYLKRLLYYQFIFQTIKCFCLFAFYGSFNYFIVQSVNSSMFREHNSSANSMILGWLFWITTLIIPIAYLVYGIIKRDLIFARVGTILIAASIFTIRYYHAVLPAELAMLLAGAVLILVSYYLLRYLKVRKHGYTSKPNTRQNKRFDIAALLVQQAFNAQHAQGDSPQPHETMYDGGSGGGAGAGGDF